MKIYLAGPDVFRNDAIWHGKRLKDLCKKFGHEGLYPLDNEIIPFNSLNIFKANCELIIKCDVICANIEDFRGPSMDVGTAWEIGFAMALHKKIILYNCSNLEYNQKAIGSPRFPVVENFGLSDNLMIIHSADFICHSFLKALHLLNEGEKNGN